MPSAAFVEPLTLSVSLAGLPPYAILQLTLSPESAQQSVAEILAMAFPPAAAARQSIAAGLDTRANPDLPDIYAAFLPVFDRCRLGLCELNLTAAGRPAELSDQASRYLSTDPAGTPFLELTIIPQYRALDYAVAQGYTPGRAELLAWLRECTILYFLDKHEYPLPARSDALDTPAAINATVESLRRQGLLDPDAATGLYAITPAGRRFIGALLAETESCIDRFDHFKDVLWDDDLDAAAFDTGRGLDLRVEMFVAEGLNPARTVFLLRLYDGTLDSYATDWPQLLGDDDFFNGILEPLVNRDLAPAELLTAILEDGYAYSQDQAATERERRRQESIARQVRALPDTGK